MSCLGFPSSRGMSRNWRGACRGLMRWLMAYSIQRVKRFRIRLGLPGREENKGISDNSLKLPKGKWQRLLSWTLLSSNEWQKQKEKSQAESLGAVTGCVYFAWLVLHRNILPRKAGQSLSLKAFKGSLSKAMTDLQYHRSQSCFKWKAGQISPEIPSNHHF